MRISSDTINLLAKSGDIKARAARNAWQSLVDFQNYPVIVVAWYNSEYDSITVELVWKG